MDLYKKKMKNLFRLCSTKKNILTKKKSFIAKKEFRTIETIHKNEYRTVYLAKLKNKKVVIKKFEKTNLKNIENEIKIMIKCGKHENVIKVFGHSILGEQGSYIIMQYCERGNLMTYLRKNKNMDSQTKIDFMLQIAKGIQFLHKRGVIHRDLKPQNVLIDKKNVLKICDFGESKNEKGIKGTLVGSCIYVDPELLNQKPKIHPKSIDIYSFGILIWTIWHQKEPYQEQMKKIHYNKFAFLNIINTKNIRPRIEVAIIPIDLIIIMEKCWHKNVEKRYKSFREIIILLNEFVFISSF